MANNSIVSFVVRRLINIPARVREKKRRRRRRRRQIHRRRTPLAILPARLLSSTRFEQLVSTLEPRARSTPVSSAQMLPGRNRHASTRIRISIRARTIVTTVVSWNGSLSTWRENGEMENCCWRWSKERGRCLEGEWKDRDRGWICGDPFPRFVFWRIDECRHWSSPLQRSSDITGRNSIVDSV